MAVAWSNFARSGNPNAQATRAATSTGTRAESWRPYAQGNFTFVLDTSPKAIRDGSEWYEANENYCAFWSPRFVGPFPPWHAAMVTRPLARQCAHNEPTISRLSSHYEYSLSGAQWPKVGGRNPEVQVPNLHAHTRWLY